MSRTIADISQTEFDTSKALSKELLQTANPTLDLRNGTALNDLLVNPGSQLAAVNRLEVDDYRKTMSLKLIQDNPELSSPEILDSIASNYNITRRTGSTASGMVMAILTTAQPYVLTSGYEMGYGSLRYKTLQSWLFIETVTNPLTELAIRLNDMGQFYVLIPMQAAASGAAYNVAENSALTVVQGGMPNVATLTVYEAFAGGTDAETDAQFANRIPTAQSHSEMSSAYAISTRLGNRFSNIHDISVVGMGKEEMLRDKHNVFGGAMGSRIDVYVKMFRQPYTRVVVKTASKVRDGVYSFTLLPEDAPGFYMVRSVTSPSSILTYETDMTALPIGSYPFTESRYPYQIETTAHDFDSLAPASTIETAYSMWQASAFTVTDIPAVVSGGVASYPDTLPLKVEVYYPENLTELQAYMDDDAMANKEADTVVRGAVLCFVTVTANIYRKSTAVLDMSAVKQAVADYINSKKFGEALTTSQLASVLHQFDIVKVNMDNSDEGMRLQGQVRGADGALHTLSGANLDIADVADPYSLITGSTALFVADPRGVFITERMA